MEPTDWEDWSPQAVAVPVHAPGHGGGVEEIEWSIVQGYFCPSSNLKVNDFPMLRAHQCYRKCSKKCFSNATFQCHCGGYYDCTGEGCDTEDSNAPGDRWVARFDRIYVIQRVAPTSPTRGSKARATAVMV